MQTFLQNTEETEQFGAGLFHTLSPGSVVFLQGQLGAGKTTLVRGYLRAAGYYGTVKSPTYNLVEEYFVNEWKINHFDLYRLNDPEELDYIGISDYFNQNSICFIEWPDQGKGFLPKPNLMITLTLQGSGRLLEIA